MPTHSKIKLLITARDPATAVSFQILIPYLANHSDFELLVLAQAPADQILADVTTLEVFQSQASLADKMQKVALVMQAFKPDAVLTGISGPDIGVDEATLKLAEDYSIPSYALQSFWGDINQATSALPKTAFVLDDEASRLTKKRYPGVRCIPIGSIKHAEFEHFDAIRQREILRPRVVSADEVLIGFYGQPLEHQLGYFDTLQQMVEQLRGWQRPFKLMYRPHPKEPESLQAKTDQLFTDVLADKVLRDPGFEITESLCICDLVVSVFSTCGFDNLYLNEMANQAFNASVYLWFDPKMIAWWQEYSGLREMPLIDEGLLLSVDNPNELIDIFEKGLDPLVQTLLKQRAAKHLPPAGQAIDRVIETLKSDLNAII